MAETDCINRANTASGFEPLRTALSHRSLSIVGLCKNAGKTTVLNRLLGLLASDVRVPALTSIGRDGESTDVVTGTDKPAIWVRTGALVATAADLLRHCDGTREILDTTGIRTPLGEVVIFRALSDGFVQLAGPSMTEQLTALSERLFGLGAGLVLIDGAISRKSLAAPSVTGATILCVGASHHPDIDTVVADAAHACRLLTLPRTGGERPGCRLVAGALTDAVLSALSPSPGDEVCVQSGDRMMLSRHVFERLTARGVRFTVETPVTLCCVCVNPFSASGAHFDAAEFLCRMRAAVDIPVIDVKREGQ